MNSALWVLQMLLGLFFVAAGINHGFRIEQARTQMAWMAVLPDNLLRFIGTCEILGGIALILPAVTGVLPILTPWAAFGLAIMMVLAAIFHLRRQEYQAIALNFILFACVAFVAYGRVELAPF